MSCPFSSKFNSAAKTSSSSSSSSSKDDTTTTTNAKHRLNKVVDQLQSNTNSEFSSVASSSSSSSSSSSKNNRGQGVEVGIGGVGGEIPKDNFYVRNYRKKLKECREDLWKLIDEINCNPILIRLAWHDSGTYDRTIKSWPECGGANGSIRFDVELKHGANAGLAKAINYLKPLKEKYPEISWADLIQLASVTAIEHANGPSIPIRYGRLDVSNEKECPKEGNLPAANPPFPDGSPDAAVHLRRVFYRMGFCDRDIVALSGAHTLGRAFAERSGTVKEGYGPKKSTALTNSPHTPRHDRKEGVGMPGGRSWTVHWLDFNEEYYHFDQTKESDKQHLVRLSTDKVLFVDETFKRFSELYANNRQQFFKDYIRAHQKLADLGSKFYPAHGFYL